jgi:hypothetical protein
MKEDLIGQRFGKLIVEKETIKTYKNGAKVNAWICQCDCGNTSVCTTSILKTGHSSSCGCQRLVVINHSYKDITGTWYGNAKKNARRNNFEFSLTKEYLQELLEKQNYRCALTNLPLHIKKIRSCKEYYQDTTASLDRIDNTKGYVEGNVQFLHKHINYMKWTHDQQYFIELCQLVSEHNKND